MAGYMSRESSDESIKVETGTASHKGLVRSTVETIVNMGLRVSLQNSIGQNHRL